MEDISKVSFADLPEGAVRGALFGAEKNVMANVRALNNCFPFDVLNHKGFSFSKDNSTILYFPDGNTKDHEAVLYVAYWSWRVGKTIQTDPIEPWCLRGGHCQEALVFSAEVQAYSKANSKHPKGPIGNMSSDTLLYGINSCDSRKEHPFRPEYSTHGLNPLWTEGHSVDMVAEIVEKIEGIVRRQTIRDRILRVTPFSR